MDITSDFVRDAILDGVNPSSFSLQVEETRNGPATRVLPNKPTAAQLSFWISEAGQCDFSFGRAFFGELDRDQGSHLLEIATSVIRGRLVEKIWAIGQHQIYSKGTVTKSEGKTVMRNGIWLFYPPFLCRTYHYEPFADD